MRGKSWNRGVCAHKLTVEAMWRVLLQCSVIPNLAQHREKDKYCKIDAFVAALVTCFSNNEVNGNEATMKSFIAHSDELMNDLQH